MFRLSIYRLSTLKNLKMKFIFVLLPIFILSNIRINAQTWFDENPYWLNYYRSGFGVSGSESVQVTGDTILQGKTAKIFTRVHDIKPPFADFTDFKVAYQSGDTIFVWNKDHFSVLYNFSLQKGDTLAFQPKDFTSFINYVLDSVGTVEIAGNKLRLQQFRQPTQYLHYNIFYLIIEKVGMIKTWSFNSNNNSLLKWTGRFFIDEGNNGVVDGADRFLCTYKNDQLEYKSGEVLCNSILNQSDFSQNVTVPKISPNPFSKSITLEFDNSKGLPDLYFWNISGQVVKKIEGLNFTTVSTSDLPVGIYFLELRWAGDGKSYFSKIVRQ